MIQDAPLLTGVNIGAAQMARMAKECANVKLTKVEAPPTAMKVTEVKQAVRRHDDDFWRTERAFLFRRIATRRTRHDAGQRYDADVCEGLEFV